jgi:hypothetical protein
MSHTMKLWEMVIEHRLRGVTNVTKNQFGFMPGRSTMEAIFLIKQLMERCKEQKKDLHMVFIDLEKTYDKVHRNVMWWAYLFALVIDEVTRDIQGGIPWCMLFADDVVLVN